MAYTGEGIKYKQRIAHRKCMVKTKLTVINHYGGKCVHCGYDDIRALQIDHINGNGAEHRRQLSKKYKAKGKSFAGYTTYRWLIQNNFPDGFQVLCANCNYIKHYEYYETNHQENIKKLKQSTRKENEK